MMSLRWSLALAALTFGACSSNTLGQSGAGGSPTGGNGYGGYTDGYGGTTARGNGGTGGGGGAGGSGGGTGGSRGNSTAGVGGTASGGTAGVTATDGGSDARDDGGRTCRPSAPCPSGWYLYSDHVCSPPLPDGGYSCSPLGDGLCYQPCTTSAGCTDPHTPNCTALYIFNGSDAGHPMLVCTSNPPLPACTMPDGGHPG